MEVFLQLILAQNTHSINTILNKITFKKGNNLYTYICDNIHEIYPHIPDIVRKDY